MIKHYRRWLFVSCMLYLLISLSFAQEQASPQNQTTQATSADEQTQQLLAQIRELQAKQKKQIQQQQDLASQRAASLQGQLHANILNQNHNSLKMSKPIYQSHFQYPFAKAQIPQSPIHRLVGHEAFSQAVQNVLPMTPQQIHRLKQIYTSAQFAAAAPAGTPPKPVATSMFVNLEPGASPPAIRLSQGFVSSLVFLDATGAPWPIEAYDLGDPKAFNIAWNRKGNVLMVQAKTLYTYGNIAVKLRGLNTPIMLTLIPGQKKVDYRVDITVPGYGPDAKDLPIKTGLPPHATPVLLKVLDGIPPEGSRRLAMSDDLGSAWLLGDKMYIRTQFTLLSPGWLATMASADGTTAYELQITPMLLFSKNGKIVHVKIGGI